MINGVLKLHSMKAAHQIKCMGQFPPTNLNFLLLNMYDFFSFCFIHKINKTVKKMNNLIDKKIKIKEQLSK